MNAPARLLAAPDPSFAAHRSTFGAFRTLPLDDLLRELEASALTGRGGAGFPVHRKLAAVARASAGGGAPAVVANGSEGEALSAKDATLLARSPHLVVDGILLCAAALGAKDLRLVVDERAAPAVRAALAERDDAFAILVAPARGGFTGGEASALVAGLDGRMAVPADRVVRLSERGLRRAPTLVQNVETLAHIALIARYGADWHRLVGAPGDPGTRLVTVSGTRSPVVREVAGGTAIRTVLRAAGEPDDRPVLVGGFHGAWLEPAALDAALSPDGLARHDASPGAGVLHVLPDGRCGLQATGDILAVLAAASTRQCGPCANGLPRLAELLRLLLAGQDVRGELHRVAGLVDGRGACHHPDGTVRMLRSALAVFSADADAHAHGRCLAREGVAA
ncbi:NADH-ubiquinone oxidoreductase-F iron-sulfur binding region domain-containing protein [Microbacterium gilvum]|uniref:NADH-ubiquinone oxidoreductase-F iron-sulfur binding region domain-containing protein n=1 Tax=Microbacterium gilvum TaxID=1336204 RepID=A0ABP9A7E4_9MICO